MTSSLIYAERLSFLKGNLSSCSQKMQVCGLWCLVSWLYHRTTAPTYYTFWIFFVTVKLPWSFATSVTMYYLMWHNSPTPPLWKPQILQIIATFISGTCRCVGVHRVLVGKPEGKRPLGRPRRRWEDNIKMDLQEVGGGHGDWMELAQDRDRWQAQVGTMRNFRVP
jgi:hypothetical protein